jgi:biopolymer transport protein ExbD
VLLLFLMLGADFSPRDQEPLLLPQAAAIRECESYMRLLPPPVTINVHHRDDRTCPPHVRDARCEEEGHWTITLNGNSCTRPEILAGRLAWAASAGPQAPERMTDRRVVVRCDANAPSGLAQGVLDVCARMGFDRVRVAARRPVRH